MSGGKAVKNILIVDDNRDAADTLSLLVRQKGHQPFVAYDSKTGLQLAADKLPDIIFHDVGMAAPDGYAVAARLRKDPVFAKTLLVAVTAYGLTEDRRRAKLAGFDLHMTKPVDFDELYAILDKIGQ